MNTYKRHRFPPDIISYAVWLYYRFNLSHRDIEDLLAERGITVTRESIRLWCMKFGALYARRLKRKYLAYYRGLPTSALYAQPHPGMALYQNFKKFSGRCNVMDDL